MTYYIEIRKSSGRKRKATFWESNVIEKQRRVEKLKDEKDADKNDT